MTAPRLEVALRFVEAIRISRLSIYDPIEIGDPVLWIPTPELEMLLHRALTGVSVEQVPLRTRSKIVKQLVAEALGYPVPPAFRRSRPRFPGQSFDTYVQKANNLQVWNEELDASRRYVLIRLSAENVVTRVKAVTGATLSLLDTTGTLTQKYQASCQVSSSASELIAVEDTLALRPFVSDSVDLRTIGSPVNHPRAKELLPISLVFHRLVGLVGSEIEAVGYDQDRLRGAALHRMVCQALGYRSYQDDGRFPDVRHQLLEVKLQTSPTIDLGLVRPDSSEPLGVPAVLGRQIAHGQRKVPAGGQEKSPPLGLRF